MPYSLAVDGDHIEKMCARHFLNTDFTAYEVFWLKHVIPLTNRPRDIQLKDDAGLAAIGKGPEHVAIAQLHYTVLRHLCQAHAVLRSGNVVDEFGLQIGLAALTLPCQIELTDPA